MANDHYVPRFYLKNFAVAGKPGRVWCYQCNRRPSLRGVKSVASEEDYYSLKTLTMHLSKLRPIPVQLLSV